MFKWAKKIRAMRRYDQSAKVYDAQYREEQEAKIRTAMHDLTINEDSLILDAGCGTGLLFAYVVKKAKVAVGADISRGILKEAKKKAKIYKNVALIRVDADNLPFLYQTFDAVFAITLLQNTPNPSITLNEIKRVSKLDSTIVITGLRKVFTEKQFSEMLRQTNLKVAVFRSDKQMKDYICVCNQIRS